MAIPVLDVKRTGPGRPRQDGDRYKGGKLKVAMEPLPKRAGLQDPSWGDNPLDAIFLAGWLDGPDYGAARTYLALRRRANHGMGGPKIALSALPEATPDIDVSGDRVRDWSRRQVVEVWDMVFGDESVLDPETMEKNREESARQIRTIHGSLSDAERSELYAICVQESWPQWFVQRKAGEAVSDLAKSENRAMTDEEQAKRFKRFHSKSEARRDLLVKALRIVRRVMSPEAVVLDVVPFDAPVIEELPPEVREDKRGFEKTNYIDRTGKLLFVAERKR